MLVVDDMPDVRLLLSRVLLRAGFDAIEATCGREALELIGRQPPDAVVLDDLMPGMDGPKFLQHLRARPDGRDMPVVVLNTDRDAKSIERAFAAGADDCLRKPIDPRILLARLRNLIDRRRRAVRADELEKENDSYRSAIAQAREVQRALLPRGVARFAGRSVAGALAASEQVGGDLFDVIETSAGSLVCVVIDVSGHGLASAMVAASVRGMLRLQLGWTPLAVALEELNRQLTLATSDGHYVCVGAIEVVEGGARVLNAGLPPIAIIESTGTRLVSATGMPLGLFSQAEQSAAWIPYTPGQRIVIMSDGVTEADGAADDVVQPLRTLGLLGAAGEAPPLALGELVRDDGTNLLEQSFERTYGAAPADDATVLVVDDLPHTHAATCREHEEKVA